MAPSSPAGPSRQAFRFRFSAWSSARIGCWCSEGAIAGCCWFSGWWPLGHKGEGEAASAEPRARPVPCWWMHLMFAQGLPVISETCEPRRYLSTPIRFSSMGSSRSSPGIPLGGISSNSCFPGCFCCHEGKSFSDLQIQRHFQTPDPQAEKAVQKRTPMTIPACHLNMARKHCPKSTPI